MQKKKVKIGTKILFDTNFDFFFFDKVVCDKNMSKFEQNLITFYKIRISSEYDGCKSLNFF